MKNAAVGDEMQKERIKARKIKDKNFYLKDHYYL